MPLNGDHIAGALRAAGAGGGLVMTPDEIAEAFNDAMRRYGDGQFTTTNTVAALVSECMMESAYFRTTEEYARTGPYQPFRGRTFIQVTWRANYLKFGQWCKSVGLLEDEFYFVKNPSRLADLRWAAIGGVWYFTKVLFHGKPLTAYADNIGQVGKAVNLGDPYSKNTPNGHRAREAAYRAVRAQGSSIVPTPPPSEEEQIMAIGKEIDRNDDFDQPLPTSEAVKVKINDKGHVSLVASDVGKSVKAVDLVSTVTVEGLQPGEYFELWFNKESKKADTPDRNEGVEDKVAFGHIPGLNYVTGQVSFAGHLGAVSGRANCLRLYVRTNSSTARITNAQHRGWKI